MLNPVFTIARYTFLEAVRNRLFVLVIISLVCILGLAEFLGELTITETRQIQSSIIGSGLRIFSVCVISLFVITSMVREFNDKGFEMLLSLSIPRASYYFGKLIGFIILAVIIASAIGLILLIYAPYAYVFLWFISLICELLIIISLSLLCLFTFNNITVAFIVVAAFYLLARSMQVIQLLSDSPILESTTISQQFLNYFLDGIAFLLPELNNFTNSEWLVYGAGINQLIPVLAQTAIYLGLLVAAGLFDLYRKEL